MVHSRRFSVIIFFGLICSLIAIAYSITHFQLFSKSTVRADSQIVKLNRQLIDLSNVYTSKISKPDKQKFAEIMALAKVRQGKLILLAQENPQVFLASILTTEQIANLPPEVKNRNLVEENIHASENLITTHFDDFKNKKSVIEYSFNQDGNRGKHKKIWFAKNPPQTVILSDSPVTISGVSIGDQVVLSDSSMQYFSVAASHPVTVSPSPFLTPKFVTPTPIMPSNQPSPTIRQPSPQIPTLTPIITILPSPTPVVSITPTPPNAMPKKIAVILFNFQNDKTQPASKGTAYRQFIEDQYSPNKYFFENSYGQITVTADVYGYVTIPYDKEAGNCSDYNSWANAADVEVAKTGVHLDAYEYFAYIFPHPFNCWAGAWANIGGKPSKMWLPGGNSSEVISHEFGHNLGQSHANFWSCTRKSTATQIDNLQDCTSREYGDPFDIMGNHWDHPNQYNGPHKRESGWLNDNQKVTITKSTILDIAPLETNSSGLKVIHVPTSLYYQDYFISYRQPYGFDSNIALPISQGIQIHIANKPSGNYSSYTYLIDPHMNQPNPNGNPAISDAWNSSLLDNEMFTDEDNGISVTLLSHNQNSATIKIDRDETRCLHQSPLLTFSPLVVTGNALHQTLPFTISLTNTDSTSCLPSDFGFYAYDSFFKIDFNVPNNKINLSPGQTAIVNATINPDDYWTKLGEHNINIYVDSGYEPYIPIHYFSNTLTFILQGSIDRVTIQPNSISTKVDADPTALSATAYDSFGRPMFNDLSYDWSITPASFSGSLTEDVNTALFTPQKPGIAQINVRTGYKDSKYVTASASAAVLPNDIVSPTSTPAVTISPSVINTPVPQNIPGDANGDNHVDGQDYAIWVTNYGQQVTGVTHGNFNGDSLVDGQDYTIWVTNYLFGIK